MFISRVLDGRGTSSESHLHSHQLHKSAQTDIGHMRGRYGEVDSVRLRSLPLQTDAGMPRRAAISSGRVDAAGPSANAYLVFRSRLAARAALAHNMQEVRPQLPAKG